MLETALIFGGLFVLIGIAVIGATGYGINDDDSDISDGTWSDNNDSDSGSDD